MSSFSWLFLGVFFAGVVFLFGAVLGLQLGPVGLSVWLSLSASLFMAKGTAALYLSSRNFFLSWNCGASKMPLSCSNLFCMSDLVCAYLLLRSCNVKYVGSSFLFWQSVGRCFQIFHICLWDMDIWNLLALDISCWLISVWFGGDCWQ